MADASGGERRCGNCGELNPARAKFCLECGTKFESAPDQESGAELTSRAELAERIVEQLPQAADHHGERRIVSVLFADLSGFTAFSEGSDVEDVRAIAQEAAGRLGDIVVKYGGTIDKIIGDCVMAVFGAPIAHEDDPERAVRAALEMQESVADNRDRFGGMKLCVGIQTGEAMWTEVGSDGYTVLGDTVNTAARLQGAADKDTVVIGQPTYAAVADVIECQILEPIKAKNKAEPVPAWRAVSVKGQRTKHKPVQAALVGRDDEKQRLQELWEVVRTERRPCTVTLLGAAGIGKTRLINSLTDDIGPDALVLRGRCLPYGEGITYWPVIEIIQQVAGINHDDPQDVVARKLDALLDGLGSDNLDELRTIAVALANLTGAPMTPRGTYSASSISKGELHWGLRRILELGAKNVPLVLIIEDLHYAEPTLIELIVEIFESKAEAPILGVGSARPEFKDLAGDLLVGNKNRRVVELTSLDEDDSRRIVTELVGADVLPTAGFEQLLHAAGGNPLFLEEIAQMWRDAGGALDDVTVPSGLQALIDTRLDRLHPTERRLISKAAVIGDVFWSGALGVLGGLNGELEDVLDKLQERDLIRMRPASTITGEHEFEFKSGLIRDVAYARLTKTERASLHERCGEWISGLPGAEQEFAEVVAYHLEQACLIASDLSHGSAKPPTLHAVNALRHAGRKAEAREGMREAARFFARAVGLLGDGFPETAAEIRLGRARLIAGLGELEEAYEDVLAVVDVTGSMDIADTQCWALLSLTEFDLWKGNASDAREHLEKAEALAGRLDDPMMRIRTLWMQAVIHELFDADPAAAADDLLSAVALAEEVDDRESVLRGRMRLGAVYFNKGQLQEAQSEFTRCMELAKEQGSLRVQAWVTAFLGLLSFHCGPREETDELYAHALEWMERTNDIYMQIQTLKWRAAFALEEDDVTGALKLLREAERLTRESGGPFGASVRRYLTEAFARQHRASDARQAAEAARADAPEEDASAQAVVLVAEAFAAAAAEDRDNARQLFSQAIPILDAQGNRIDIGETRIAFARLLTAWGDTVAAADQLERARQNFAEVGGVATVQQIDEWVERIRSEAPPEAASATA